MKSRRMWVWLEKRRDPGLTSLHSEVEEDPAEDTRWKVREVTGKQSHRQKASSESVARRVTHWAKESEWDSAGFSKDGHGWPDEGLGKVGADAWFAWAWKTVRWRSLTSRSFCIKGEAAVAGRRVQLKGGFLFLRWEHVQTLLGVICAGGKPDDVGRGWDYPGFI